MALAPKWQPLPNFACGLRVAAELREAEHHHIQQDIPQSYLHDCVLQCIKYSLKQKKIIQHNLNNLKSLNKKQQDLFVCSSSSSSIFDFLLLHSIRRLLQYDNDRRRSAALLPRIIVLRGPDEQIYTSLLDNGMAMSYQARCLILLKVSSLLLKILLS